MSQLDTPSQIRHNNIQVWHWLTFLTYLVQDELFNGYFASVSVIDDDLLPICDNVAVSSTIDNIRFDEAKVLVAMHVQTETKSFCRTRLSAVHTV